MKAPVIIGHRGAPFEAPENTASSFSAALSGGAEVIETDVRLSLDGHLVVSHDEDFSRLGGPSRTIKTCSREEISGFALLSGNGDSERPLFLDEALNRFPDTRFNVDLKDSGADIVRAWVDLLERSAAGNRCRTASFYDRSLRIYKSMKPAAPVSVARFGVAWLLLLSLLGISRKPGSGEAVLQIPERAGVIRVLSRRTLKLWQSYGWIIEVWTVDNEEDMIRLIDWGVDGIITNRPSLLKELLNRHHSEENP